MLTRLGYFARETLVSLRRNLLMTVAGVLTVAVSLALFGGIMRILDRINRTGTTVVMATHDQRIVDAMRRRVVELDHGAMVRDDTRGVYGVGG